MAPDQDQPPDEGKILNSGAETTQWGMFENAGNGITVIGTDRRWKKVNKRFCEIVGYSEADLVGRDVFEFTFEPDRVIVNDAQSVSRGETDHLTIEKRYVHSAGHTVWVRITSSVQRDEQGETLSWLSFIEDISDLKRSQMRLNTEHAVSHVLATGSSLEIIAAELLEVLCKNLDMEIGELWLPSDDNTSIFADKVLTFGALENSRQKWLDLTESTKFRAGEGLPGVVWRDGSPKWFLDVSQGPPSPRKSMAVRLGITSNLAFPLKTGDQCIGVICLHARRKLVADEMLEETLASLGQDIAQFALKERAERTIAENEERLRLAADASGIGVWDYDIRNGQIKWSEQLENLYGLEKGEFDGTFEMYSNLLHPEDRDKVLGAVEQAYSGQPRYTVVHRIVRVDGEMRWVEGHGTLLRDARGEPVRLFGVAIDITDRMRTEESQKLLADVSTVLGASLDYEETLAKVARLAVPTPADWCAVDILAPDGSIQRVATAHVDPAKVELAAEVGRRFPPDESGFIRQVINTGEPALIPRITEEMLIGGARNGEHLEILQALNIRSVVSVPLAAGNQVHGALTLVASDSGRTYDESDLLMARELGYRCSLAITNAQLYRDLLSSETRFRSTFETAAAGVAIVGINGRYIRTNQKFCEILGYEEDELLNESFQTITHPVDLEAELVEVDRLIEGDISEYTIEKRFIRKDASTVWVSLNRSLVFDAEGNPDYSIVVALDITERKSLEDSLRQSNENLEKRVSERTEELQRLADSLRLLATRLSNTERNERRRLAGIIHDDLQQLLVAAKMQINSLQLDGNATALESTRDLALSLLDQAIEGGRSLTAQLRPPALYESGLEASLTWLVKWMKQAHGIQIDLTVKPVPEELPEEEAMMLFEAIRELLLNAVKYSKVDIVNVAMCRYDDNFLTIKVSDKGAGFDVTKLQNPRADSGGFGLFGIRERVAAMGGRFVIQSAPGVGSTFQIFWPLNINNGA